MGDSTEKVKEVVVEELVRAASDSPQVKEAGRELGQAALTIAKTINAALLPLAAVNFAFDKAKAYFSGKFQEDLSKKAAAIPLEEVIEPKASIAGPALQGLAFTHEEPNLKEMYLNLLTTAMDGRKAENAHPAFVEIIRQLSSEEANLLHELLASPLATPIVELRSQTDGKRGWHVLVRHLINAKNIETGEPIEVPAMEAMVDNWIRLGLVEVDYAKYLMAGDRYTWVEERPEYKRFYDQVKKEGKKITWQRGVLNRTALGLQFAKAIDVV